VVGKDVDQFDYEIRIRSARGDEKLRFDVSRNCDVLSQRFSLISENILPSADKSLILGHEISGIVERNLLCVRHRVHWIADVFVERVGSRTRRRGKRKFAVGKE